MTVWMEMGIVRGSDGLEGGRTVDLLEVVVGWGFDDIEDGDDLNDATRRVTTSCRLMHGDGRRTFSLTQESEKNFKSLSSRRVRRQKRGTRMWSYGDAFCVPESRAAISVCPAISASSFAVKSSGSCVKSP